MWKVEIGNPLEEKLLSVYHQQVRGTTVTAKK
jgi:hypothetical protein